MLLVLGPASTSTQHLRWDGHSSLRTLALAKVDVEGMHAPVMWLGQTAFGRGFSGARRRP